MAEDEEHNTFKLHVQRAMSWSLSLTLSQELKTTLFNAPNENLLSKPSRAR